jgi:hypothetical protein
MPVILCCGPLWTDTFIQERAVYRMVVLSPQHWSVWCHLDHGNETLEAIWTHFCLLSAIVNLNCFLVKLWLWLTSSSIDKTPRRPCGAWVQGASNVQITKICRRGFSDWFSFFWQKAVLCIPVMRSRSNWRLRSSRMLRCVGWWLVSDVSGQIISPIFKYQAVGKGIERVIA